MLKHVRNQGFVPDLETEGTFLKPLDVPKTENNVHSELLKPYERMHAHHTLSSARRYTFFQPHKGLIPSDDLDFLLNANYDHSFEFFPDPIDVYLQDDTVGKSTWRRSRNITEVKPLLEARANVYVSGCHERAPRMKIPYKYNPAHPVIISGITERIHPSNVKLMNSSHHSPQTNAGYSRQDSDGNVFQY